MTAPSLRALRNTARLTRVYPQRRASAFSALPVSPDSTAGTRRRHPSCPGFSALVPDGPPRRQILRREPRVQLLPAYGAAHTRSPGSQRRRILPGASRAGTAAERIPPEFHLAERAVRDALRPEACRCSGTARRTFPTASPAGTGGRTQVVLTRADGTCSLRQHPWKHAERCALRARGFGGPSPGAVTNGPRRNALTDRRGVREHRRPSPRPNRSRDVNCPKVPSCRIAISGSTNETDFNPGGRGNRVCTVRPNHPPEQWRCPSRRGATTPRSPSPTGT